MSTDSPTLQTLVNVLVLERDQGYSDRAVIGGLEGFVVRWEREQGDHAPSGVRLAVAGLHGYGLLAPDARAKRVRAVLRAARNSGVDSPGSSAPDLRHERSGRPAGAVVSSAPRPSAEQAALDVPEIDRPVVHMRGIGRRSAENLSRLGVHTIRDLLYHVPHRYDDWSAVRQISKLTVGEQVTVVGTVWAVRSRELPGKRHVLNVILSDTTATVACVFFNQPYLEREFRQGRRIVVSGKVDVWAGKTVFRAPEWEPLDRDPVHTGRLVPVYSLTEGVGQRWLRRQVKSAVDQYASRVAELLPARVLERYGLPPIAEALREVHFPADWEALARARRRLAFDDLFVLHVRGLLRRRRWGARSAVPLTEGRGAREALVVALPFALTGDQQQAIEEIATDLSRATPMIRLLQGDVGSGKTVVAAAAAATAVGAGQQAALMAPTEILAEQHLASLRRLLAPLGYRLFSPDGGGGSSENDGPVMAALLGRMGRTEKEAVVAAARSGAVDLLVGTHALIQESVVFDRLALAIVDEQHRFGVMQRSELALKGTGPRGDGADWLPHVLIMTATPIPRTLAQAINADLDQSVISELPPGRKPIQTRRLTAKERERAYQFIRHRVSLGEQAYIVYPLVEGSETIEARSAIEEHERLSGEVFPDLRVGLVHGRLSAAEKEEAMARFHAGDTDVLVATSVVEVGVDVPNATVILIDGADRFGLAQLHQFRGRVGRGTADSVCLLLAESPTSAAAERLDAMVRTADGLELAELDLKMRGPGDFFGVRQSGLFDELRFARHAAPGLVGEAREAAAELLETDPDLEGEDVASLRELVSKPREQGGGG